MITLKSRSERSYTRLIGDKRYTVGEEPVTLPDDAAEAFLGICNGVEIVERAPKKVSKDPDDQWQDKTAVAKPAVKAKPKASPAKAPSKPKAKAG